MESDARRKGKGDGLSAIDAAYIVLVEAGEPLHPREIARRMLERGLWQTAGKTPHETVKARLASDIEIHGKESRFRRVRPGIYATNHQGDSGEEA